jgi:predicted PurR-regulated permease PerM
MLLFLLILLGFLTYKIMRPFLNAIAWSIVVSIVFYPLYAFISRHVRVKSAASILTLILILTVILGPFAYVASMLVNEVQSLVAASGGGGLDAVRDLLDRVRTSALFKTIGGYAGLEDALSEEVLRENIGKAGRAILEQASLRITNLVSIFLDFIFMTFTTFFLLRDGPGFLAKLTGYLPFSGTQKERIHKQVKDMIVSTVYGGVAIAIVQGILGGFAFYVAGIEAPFLWGTAMSVMSFVPMVGTFSIWGPASAYMLFQGDYLKGAGMLLYGIFVISSVDNILKPIIIGSRTKMPTIVILFSVLGGIKLFGMIGLIMGPLITAVFISVLEIFSHFEGEEPA